MEHTIYEQIKSFRKAFMQSKEGSASAMPPAVPMKDEKPVAATMQDAAALEEGETRPDPGALPSFKKSLHYKPAPRPAVQPAVQARRPSRTETADSGDEERLAQERMERMSAKERKQARLEQIRKARAEQLSSSESVAEEEDEVR